MDAWQDIVEGRFDGEITMDQAVSNISFLEALEYCERTGTRLPTLKEYLFAATNGGTTETPWGGPFSEIADWNYDLPNTHDHTLAATPVLNLCSSVAEWTQSLFIPSGVVPSFRDHLKHSRVVVGGTRQIAEGAPGNPNWPNGIWTFANLMSNEQFSALGFRVARSVARRTRDPR